LHGEFSAAAQSWFEGPAGRRVLAQERRLLDEALDTAFGYFLAQVGRWGRSDEFCALSTIRQRMLVASQAVQGVDVCAYPAALPLLSDGIDAVILPHLLERVADPHGVLREAERVLVGEGQVFILGFNPWSLWGLRNLFLRRSQKPWAGRYLGEGRLRDWLALLGFDVVSVERYLFGWPSDHPFVARRSRVIERVGRRWWPRLNGAYLIVARKRVVPLTPVRPRWRPARGHLVGGLVEPTPRRMH
jgi:SAM-dependent methyltransferase